MNEDNFILEDIDRELTFDEKVNKIVDEFNPEAVEYTADDNNGWSVKIKDKNSEMEFWVDVWVDTNYNDVETEWNQYIFDIQDDDDQLRSAIQNDNNVWDLASSEAVNYLEENNEIKQNEKGEWEVVYKTPDGEFYEIYEEDFNDETGDIEGAGRIWNVETGMEREFVFTFDVQGSAIYFNDFSTGDELDIRNENLINEIKSFADDHKDEIEHYITFTIDESKKVESKKVEAKQDKYEYQSYTFIPVGNIKSNLNVYDYIRKNDTLNKKFDTDDGSYNYEEFYKIMPSVDIFKMPELDNILVMPGSNFLFEFTGDDDTIVPVGEFPSDEELRKEDEMGYIGTEEDKEVVDDLLDDDKDYMDISSKYGYSFNDYQLYNIATLYEKADNTVKTKIEDVLDNINYHSECSDISANANAFKYSLFENKKVTEDIDEEKTKVIFRKDKEDGDIIAVFAEDIQSNNMIGCYVHLGQHTTMSLDYYSKETIPATPEEYADLKRELESIGYNIEVVTELDESKIKKIETVDEENSLDDTANYIKGIVDYDVSITPTGKGFSSYDVDFLNTDGSIMYSVMVNDDAIKDKVRLLNTLVLELKRLYRGKTFADIIREKLLDELNKIHPVSKKTEDVAINNGFDITKYQEIQNLADDIANSIKDKDNITIDNVIEAIENWDNGFSSVITALATADKNLANEIEKDEYDRYEAENQFLGLVEDTLNDMGITVYDEYDLDDLDDIDNEYDENMKIIESKGILKNIQKQDEIDEWEVFDAEIDEELGKSIIDTFKNYEDYEDDVIPNVRIDYNTDDGRYTIAYVDMNGGFHQIDYKLTDEELAELKGDKKTEDATQCGAVDGGRVSIFGEKEKIEEDNEYFSYVASRDVKETLNDLLSGNYDIMYDYNVENFVDDLIDYLDTLDDSKAHSIAWELNQACISAEKSNRRASGTKPRKLIQALKSAKAYLDNIK